MIFGLASGILWSLDTVVLGIALAMQEFVSTEQAILLAPFVSTFLHDFFSSLWMTIYMGVKGQYSNVIRALKTKSGKYIMLGALLGGPVGMSGYVAAINYIGPGYTAIISAMYPALGVFLAHIILKERMSLIQLIALFISIGGIVVLGYTPDGTEVNNVILGFTCALLACIGWGSEAVICAYGMQDPNVSDEQALMIRQFTSAIVYGLVIISFMGGWGFTFAILPKTVSLIVLLTALFGTSSYLFYYRAIATIGPSKAMPLNITYSAWAILFSWLLLGTVPDMKEIICGIVIVVASIVAATDLGYHDPAEDLP